MDKTSNIEAKLNDYIKATYKDYIADNTTNDNTIVRTDKIKARLNKFIPRKDIDLLRADKNLLDRYFTYLELLQNLDITIYTNCSISDISKNIEELNDFMSGIK